MKGIVSFYTTILALQIAYFHINNVVCRIQPPGSSSGPLLPEIAPSFSPAPQSEDPQPASPPVSSSGVSPDTAPPALSPMPDVEDPEPAIPPSWDVFDVTDYGAIPNGKAENSRAFLAAWNAACVKAGNSVLYIPRGTYYIGPISFLGPCRNNQSPLVKIEGTLVAPSSQKAFPTSDWIEFRNLNGLSLIGGTEVVNFDGQGSEAWKQTSCKTSHECKVMIASLKFCNVYYGSISHVSLLNSKSFHIIFDGSRHITIENVTITAPGDSPNTDGIHIGRSTNISIVFSQIGVGDDCVSIGPGSVDITVSDVRCGPGHGLSVGSLGKYLNEEEVRGITVQRCTMIGTENGVRVKTWPGLHAGKASNITFQDINMFNVSNPLIVDQEYCPPSTCDLTKPSLVELSDITFKNVNGTYNTENAVQLVCSSMIPCEDIKIIDVDLDNTISSNDTDPKQSRMKLKGLIKGLKVSNSTF